MTRDVFSPTEAIWVPPSLPVRHWHTAIGLGLTGAVFTFVGTAFALWRSVPLLVAPPAGGFSLHLAAWAKMILYAMTGGSVGGASVHEYFDWVMELSSVAPETSWAVWSRFAVCVVAALVVGTWLLRVGLTPRNAEQHLVGARLLTGPEALRAARAESARLRGSVREGFLKLHAALDLPLSQWRRHLWITGSVGSGKSQIIAPVIEQIVAANHKALILDLKGEYTAAFHTCVLLNPFDARSAIWDIGRDLVTRDDAQVFAASLIGDNEKNPFFTTSAQMLLTGILWSLQSELGRDWGWRELAERAAFPSVQLEALLKSHYPEAAALIQPQARSAGDVHSTLLTATRLLRSLAAAWGETPRPDGTSRRGLSLRAWMRDDYQSRARQIVLGSGPNPQLTNAYVAAALNVLVPHLVSPELPDDPARALFFVFDELPAVGKINLPPLIDRGRSKGCICILGLQDEAQLRRVYGPELAQALPSMIANHVVCQIGPGETRETIANRVGKRRVAVHEATTSNQGGSQRIVEHHDRPIVLASDLTQGLGPQKYKKGFHIRALVMLGGDLLRLDFPGATLPKRRRAFVPAPWLAPVKGAAPEPAAAAAPAPSARPTEAGGVGSMAATPAREELLRLADRLDAVRRSGEPDHAHDPAP